MRAHELTRVFDKGARRAALYCKDCNTVYPYDWADYKDGEPSCPVLAGAHCNQCGLNMMSDDMGCVYGLEARFAGGYQSTALYDCTEYRFRLCEECLAKLFEQFDSPVKVRQYMGGDNMNWRDGSKGKDWKQ